MSDQINRNTMKIHISVDTTQFLPETFLNVSGMEMPACASKYWKIVDEVVVEMTTEEKAVVDYVEPVPEPTLAEYKVIAEAAIKAACTAHIKDKYSPEIQTSAALHVYKFEFEMAVSQFLVNNIKEENRCKDAIVAATTIAEVDAVTPTWSEV